VYKRILVPLDGSTFAEASLPLALALTRKTNASLHLVSVVEPIPAFAYAEWEPAALDWSTQYLDSVSERVAAAVTRADLLKGMCHQQFLARPSEETWIGTLFMSALTPMATPKRSPIGASTLGWSLPSQ